MISFSKKAILGFSLFFIFSFCSIFAENWFVCLGSFRVKQNADNRVAELNKHDIPAFVYETESEGQILYRVLLNEKHTDRNS